VQLKEFFLRYNWFALSLMGASPESVALLMADFRRGDRASADQLVEVFYPELRRLASSQMKGERAEHTWQPTVLINELYLELTKIRNLAGGEGADEQERAAFLGFAGHLMKRLLIHHARPLHRRVEKVELQEDTVSAQAGAEPLVEVEDALSRLATVDPNFRIVVEMRVFEGLTSEEIARQLGCSRRTVATYWNFAKGWLQREWARSQQD
jgi:RNA polymerase sigma factor (TIGR02999 family)